MPETVARTAARRARTVVLIALAVVTYQLRLSAWRVFAVVVLIWLGYLAVLGVRTLVRTRR